MLNQEIQDLFQKIITVSNFSNLKFMKDMKRCFSFSMTKKTQKEIELYRIEKSFYSNVEDY